MKRGNQKCWVRGAHGSGQGWTVFKGAFVWVLGRMQIRSVLESLCAL